MATTNDFYIWPCPKDQVDYAYRNAKIRIENGEYARDKRLDVEQRTIKIAIGYIGEYGFQHWCRQNEIDIQYLGEIVGEGPDNGDFKTRIGLIIDVKTQENKYTPQVDWRCEVTDEQIGRPADIYVFCKLRMLESSNTLYIVGWEYEKDFKEKASYRKKGDILRGKPVHYPKWDMTIEELKPLSSLINVIR